MASSFVQSPALSELSFFSIIVASSCCTSFLLCPKISQWSECTPRTTTVHCLGKHHLHLLCISQGVGEGASSVRRDVVSSNDPERSKDSVGAVEFLDADMVADCCNNVAQHASSFVLHTTMVGLTCRRVCCHCHHCHSHPVFCFLLLIIVLT